MGWYCHTTIWPSLLAMSSIVCTWFDSQQALVETKWLILSMSVIYFCKIFSTSVLHFFADFPHVFHIFYTCFSEAVAEAVVTSIFIFML